MNETVTVNVKGIDALLRALKGKMPVARVGILGKNNTRTQDSTSRKTNAEIGVKHEYGLDGMPIRSFLRMPLMNYLQKFMEKNGAFDKKAMDEVIKQKSIFGFMEKIGITAVEVVNEAFNTGGFGQWKPSNMERKKVHQTLVETQQLRNSITYEVK